MTVLAEEERERTGGVAVCLVCDTGLWAGRGEGRAHMVHTSAHASRLSIPLFFCFTPGFGVTWEITP